MKLRTGITTGTCGAAAAKAAAMVLCGQSAPARVTLDLPTGQSITVDISHARLSPSGAQAAVVKDAGDDPDVTDGLEIVAEVSLRDGSEVSLSAGDGVGVITKPGLQSPVGGPAINPVPQKMIRHAVRQVTDRGMHVEISIPGGRKIAEETFNPRLGIQGGLSILGTTGIVRPYCRKAFRDAIACALDVAAACSVDQPVLVPGNIGMRGACRHLDVNQDQVIEVGNEWGFALDDAASRGFNTVRIVGHPGKLAKLAEGHWNTHSSHSPQATGSVRQLAEALLDRPPADTETVEGVLASLDSAEKAIVGSELAERIRNAIAERMGDTAPVSVWLIDMQGDLIGQSS
jgi:cobalt-precorrin-5B (C1)-methyltransferase